MLKLKKYLKPFISGLILTLILLFGQALCDLNLPNFMSEIVNVGIQQNGIEHAALDAISQNGMKMMTTFMTDSEKQLVEQNYTLVSVADKNTAGKIYADLYPQADAFLYVKNDVDKATLAELDTAFGAATWTMINIFQDLAEQSGQNSANNSITDIKDVDISQLYIMQPMFASLADSTISAAHDKALDNESAILNQSGIMLAKAFYSELGVNISALESGYIIRIGLFMLLIAMLGGLATILVSLLSSRIAAGTARNLRKDVFAKIESFSRQEFDQFSTASLITRCTNDITQIQQFLMLGIRMICYAPIMGIGGIIMAVNKSVSMSWIIAVACIALIGLILVILAIAMPKFKIIQKFVDRLNLVSREALSGMMVIRAFSTQNHEEKRFTAANNDLTATNLFINRVMVFMMPIMMLLMNGITVLIVWVGAHQIVSSSMQVGDMMAFMQYAMQIIMAFLMISIMFIFWPRAAVSAVRIAEVLETKNSIVDPQSAKKFNEAEKGLVEFRHVYFRYHDAEADTLSDITFCAKPGQTTAIIGSTGSGKSTIANLVLRFYDVNDGQILVDGVDVREVRLKDLRAKIGYTPQKGMLFSGTISSNLRYGKKDASDNDVEIAATVAQAMEFISEKPERFDSEISQGGTNISGGQKQRLSIARALTKEPEILIFDDSFSALDFKTDASLRKNLKEYTKNSTVIVISQRVSTIMQAEKIIVLDEGMIVGSGTHWELLNSCRQYYEIAASQLSQEELA